MTYYPPRPRSNHGLLAFGIGLPSVLLGWIPFIGWICFPAAIIAIVVGVKAIKLSNEGYEVERGLAVTGIVLGAISLLFVILGFLFFVMVLGA